MTAKRMPKRGPHGEFLSRNAPSDAQRDEKERKQQERPLPSPSGIAKRCEECSETMTETRVIRRGHVIYLTCCPRCTPEPFEILNE